MITALICISICLLSAQVGGQMENSLINPDETRESLIRLDGVNQTPPGPDDLGSRRRVPGLSPEVASMQLDLFNHGRQRAMACGTLESQEEDIRVLVDYGQAMAQQIHCAAFDPAIHLQDRLREAEFERLNKNRHEAEQSAMHAGATRAKCEDE